MTIQSFKLNFLDIFIFLLSIILTFFAVFIGNLLAKREIKIPKFLDHMLMGRKLTLPLFTATLVATWYGGIFGVTDIAYKHGIYNFVTQGLFWYVTYIIFAFFLVPRLRQFESITLPELVAQLYGKKAGIISSFFNFFNVLPIAYTISIGIFIQFFTNLDFLTSCLIGMLLVCAYSIWGGFRAIVFSDFVQCIVMCLGVFAVVLFSYMQFGGINFLKQNLPLSYFDYTGGHGLGETFVWGFIALGTLVDPNFYQRCFAADSHKTARAGILLATLIWFGFDLCTTFGAMYARAVMQEQTHVQPYLQYGLAILPNGLKGLFLAGIVATILSTLDSFLFVATNTISYDLAPKFLKLNVNFHNVCIFLVGFLTVYIATIFDGSIKDVWKTFGSYSAGCLLIPMLIGLFRPKLIGEKTFIMSCLLSAIGITYWRFTEHDGFWSNVDDLYVGLMISISTILLSKCYRNR